MSATTPAPALTVASLLHLRTLTGARVLTGADHLHRPVAEINVLEAADLAPYLNPGTVLLTSYFALESLTTAALETFLDQMAALPLAAFIIKLDRLIPAVPPPFIAAAAARNIPVITISKDVKYSEIITEALLPIIDYKAGLLDLQRRWNERLDEWRRTEHTLAETVDYFATVLGHELVVRIHGQDLAYASAAALPGATPTATQRLPLSEHTKLRIYRDTYPPATRLRVHLAEFVNLPWHLEIQGMPAAAPIDDDLLAALEHMMRLLHVELLAQRNIDNMLYFNRHNLVDELLTNTSLSARNTNSILGLLELDRSPFYQVIQVTLLDSPLHDAATPLRLARKLAAALAPLGSCAYHVSHARIALILNLAATPAAPDSASPTTGILTEAATPISATAPQPAPASALTPPGGATAAQLRDLLADWAPASERGYVAGLSAVGLITDLHQLRDQTQQVKDILKATGRFNQPLHYRDLGVFRLFRDAPAIAAMARHVPAPFAQLHRDHPVLFETLRTYLDCSENVTATAQALVVHPKTVRYRLDAINRLGLVNYADPEQRLEFMFCARLLQAGGD